MGSNCSADSLSLTAVQVSPLSRQRVPRVIPFPANAITPSWRAFLCCTRHWRVVKTSRKFRHSPIQVMVKRSFRPARRAVQHSGRCTMAQSRRFRLRDLRQLYLLIGECCRAASGRAAGRARGAVRLWIAAATRGGARMPAGRRRRKASGPAGRSQPAHGASLHKGAAPPVCCQQPRRIVGPHAPLLARARTAGGDSNVVESRRGFDSLTSLTR